MSSLDLSAPAHNVALDEYIEAHTTAEHPYLRRLYRATHLHLLHARMASGHVQGLLLKMLAQLSGARRVLEVGTYSGYATLALASGMPAGSSILTFEINDEQEDFTRPWLEGAPWEVDIEMVIGDVLAVLPTRTEAPFDLIYIDGNKRDYVAYFDLLYPLLAPGGLLIADNTLWDGHVVEASYAEDAQTKSIKAFNDLVAQHPDLDTLILPLRDGLTVARKR
ncbi:MAG: O-methyltransferase [Alloprevotella sp.]|nr:O-methyltransferase [Alloprevotella sp.]